MKTLLKSCILIILCSINLQAYSSENTDLVEFVNEKREYLAEAIKCDKDIKALAIALFTNDKIIWQEFFGKTTYNRPINDSTLFSVQSISKNFTALAILFAVQDGLVNLDTPITIYLPDFKVNSCYEKSPETKITLRKMLTHTAGFTHEAPCGNNYDFRCQSKRIHWNSIRETWLKFPVGMEYSYSNLGYDLAAEIIETVSGMSFEAYLEKKIFKPLNMKYSTLDDNKFVENKNKTEGYISRYTKQEHHKIPLIGSGAVYSNINEMIKYIQFHMNFGNLSGKQLIKREHLLEMYQQHKKNYGLGIVSGTAVNKEYDIDTYYLNHNGGGFGYGSTMTWVPEYGIGCVALGYGPARYSSLVIDNVLFDYIIKFKTREKPELNRDFNPLKNDKNHSIFNKNFISPKNIKNFEPVNKKNLTGTYEVVFGGREFTLWGKILRFFGFLKRKVKIHLNNDNLIMKGYFGEHKLKEYFPGLFFTTAGEAFDFRKEYPTYRNIKLRKL